MMASRNSLRQNQISMGLTVNHHQHKVLHAIFAHPLNTNLEMKDLVTVLNGLGAEIDAKSKSRPGVTLNGHITVLRSNVAR
jgi:hypothetical protein